MLIVVIVMAVLAGLLLPRITGQPERAKTAEAINMIGAIRNALYQYYDEHEGSFPTANITTPAAFKTTLAIELPATTANSLWTYSLDVATTKISATRNNTAGGTLDFNYGTDIWEGTGDYCGPIGNSGCGGSVGKYWPFD